MKNVSFRDMVKISLFTAMACVTAMVVRFGTPAVVPFSPMPMVMMLAGGLLGSTNGAISMALYLILGLIGLPVFASPPFGGLAYVFQPSFGFLLGFVAGAWVTGFVLSNGRDVARGGTKSTYLRFLLAMIAGIPVMYAVGLPYLYLILNVYLGKSAGALTVLKIGFLPFIAFDLVKAVIAAHLAFAVSRRLSRAVAISR